MTSRGDAEDVGDEEELGETPGHLVNALIWEEEDEGEEEDVMEAVLGLPCSGTEPGACCGSHGRRGGRREVSGRRRAPCLASHGVQVLLEAGVGRREGEPPSSGGAEEGTRRRGEPRGSRRGLNRRGDGRTWNSGVYGGHVRCGALFYRER